jgi:hypothetical protein
MDIQQYLERVSLVNSDDAWFEAFANNRELRHELEEKIKRRLYSKGTDANGDVIGTYKLSTQEFNPKKRAGTHFTLFDTGDFYRSIHVNVYEDEFEIEADGQKWGVNILLKYGDEIFGIDEETMGWLRGQIREGYDKYLRGILDGH